MSLSVSSSLRQIVHPFPIKGQTTFINLPDAYEQSRKFLPHLSRIRVLSVGPEAISFGNGKFLWENKLGLQASTHWYGRLELDPGFGSRSDGRVLRPTFTKGMKIIFVKGETTLVKVQQSSSASRAQGSYARQGSDMDVKNWRVDTTGASLEPIKE